MKRRTLITIIAAGLFVSPIQAEEIVLYSWENDHEGWTLDEDEQFVDTFSPDVGVTHGSYSAVHEVSSGWGVALFGPFSIVSPHAGPLANVLDDNRLLRVDVTADATTGEGEFHQIWLQFQGEGFNSGDVVYQSLDGDGQTTTIEYDFSDLEGFDPNAPWMQFRIGTNNNLGNPGTIWVDNLRVTTAPELIPGDMNFDGVVDTGDVAPFVLALTDAAAYQSQFGVDEATMIAAGDINNDGAFDTGDVAPFVQMLVGGGSATVPEPGSLALLGLGGLMLLRRRRAA